MKTEDLKKLWKIIKKKKSDRTIMEKVILSDYIHQWFCAPIRIIMFPIAIIVKVYKWTYDL